MMLFQVETLSNQRPGGTGRGCGRAGVPGGARGWTAGAWRLATWPLRERLAAMGRAGGAPTFLAPSNHSDCLVPRGSTRCVRVVMIFSQERHRRSAVPRLRDVTVARFRGRRGTTLRRFRRRLNGGGQHRVLRRVPVNCGARDRCTTSGPSTGPTKHVDASHF